MAFFLLFTGLLVGASLVSLSESERDYYYNNRTMMEYLGNKDGVDVYRDPYSGQFYVDDGWDVSRVGKAGFVPHPVERLKQLCQKYNPQNLPWVSFLLASFEGREKELWLNFFDKYELGPKPKEPTWGKGIRKARWADYETQLQAWEARKAALKPVFDKESREWEEKRRQYDASHQVLLTQSSGRVLLNRALSGNTVIVQAVAPSTTMKYNATVPSGSRPGEIFMVNAGGQMMAVTVPPGAYPGMTITFDGPAIQAQVVQTAKPADVPPPAVRAAPPAAAAAPPGGGFPVPTGIAPTSTVPPAVAPKTTSTAPPGGGFPVPNAVAPTSSAPPKPTSTAAPKTTSAPVPPAKTIDRASSMQWGS